MKRILFLVAAMALFIGAQAQTLNVAVGNVTYKFPAASAGEMTYSGGTSLTVLGKTFTLGDVSQIYIDDSKVVDNAVSVVYNGSSASVSVAGNVARYVEPAVNGAHVSIAQSSDVDSSVGEITYTLSGTSADGEFYLSGSYKSTVELNGLTLTNVNPVYSGAAVHIQNGKRINIKVVTGTVNTLTDAAGGSQKGCLYVKGHAEFKQKGTLNVYGNTKHGIKAGEYVSVKNCTINVLSAAGDGISCNQYFLMESGAVNISGTNDDGIQCDIDGTESTGEIADHEDEDSGNIYISGGSVSVNVEGIAAKGIKGEGDMKISGGTIVVTTSGKGEWDSEDLETKAACGLSCDGNMTISGGELTITSTGAGGKGIKCDGWLNVSGNPVITVKTSGGLYYNNGSSENTNYTGNTDRISSNYYSSPKGIKAGLKTSTSGGYAYSGGIVISGGTINVSTSGNNAEGIESKNTLEISGGHITVNAYDDAINSGQDMTITGGYVYARGMANDGLDSNGNLYIKGGLVFAIGSASPELAIDANSEEQKKFYLTGGTIVAVGGLESGSSLTQACYSSSSWSKNAWYALTYGDETFAFKTPASGGNTLVVSASSTPTLKSGVTVTGGTAIFDGMGYVGASVSGGTSVSLSNYTSNGGGNRPGGGGGWH